MFIQSSLFLQSSLLFILSLSTISDGVFLIGCDSEIGRDPHLVFGGGPGGGQCDCEAYRDRMGFGYMSFDFLCRGNMTGLHEMLEYARQAGEVVKPYIAYKSLPTAPHIRLTIEGLRWVRQTRFIAHFSGPLSMPSRLSLISLNLTACESSASLPSALLQGANRLSTLIVADCPSIDIIMPRNAKLRVLQLSNIGGVKFDGTPRLAKLMVHGKPSRPAKVNLEAMKASWLQDIDLQDVHLDILTSTEDTSTMRSTPRDPPSYTFLKNVRLSGLGLSRFDASVIGRMPNVQQLDLSHNHITSIDWSTTNFMAHLGRLSLAHNGLTTEGLEGGQLMETESNQLMDIDLAGNHLTRMPQFLMAQFPNVRQLNLSSNSFSSLPLDMFSIHWADGNKLRNIDLSHNHITSIHPDVFAQSPRLRHAWFDGNAELASAQVERLHVMSAETGVHARGTRVTCTSTDLPFKLVLDTDTIC